MLNILCDVTHETAVSDKEVFPTVPLKSRTTFGQTVPFIQQL